MKKTGALFLITFILIMSCLLAGCSFDNSEKETVISSVGSDDGNYTVVLYQTGEPQGTFGDVKAKLVLQNSSGETLDEESFELANDGGGVRGNNITDIVWSDNSAEVHMREFDTDRMFTYILEY